jgi:hypothetical protein
MGHPYLIRCPPQLPVLSNFFLFLKQYENHRDYTVTANLKPLVDLLHKHPPPALQYVNIKGVQELTPATAIEMRRGDNGWEQSLGRYVDAAMARTFTWSRRR